MSTIDLERLIVRQRYFIPIETSKLIESVQTELEADWGSIGGIKAWYLYEEHKNSFCFIFSMIYHFVKHEVMGSESGTREYKMLVRRKKREYSKRLPDSFHITLADRYNFLPMRIYVFVINEEEKGCTCDIECFPTLYEKMKRRVLEEDPTEFDIQDAYLTCKRFVKTTFEGGLSATLISEEKRELEKPTAQLLINDESFRQILIKIEEMLDQATGEVLLCGWIGTLLLPKLKEINQKGVNIRLITHKDTELKGKHGHRDVQTAYKELISMISEDNISIRPECHCRVVIVDNKALIGSMDIYKCYQSNGFS